nr:TPA_asm: hypothetical protein HUJ06_029985 [Nelumbo nucifera]
MAYQSISLSSLYLLFLLPSLISAISSCGGPCQTSDDCDGQLICSNGGCTTDPDAGTTESPPVTSSTEAILTNNDFSQGGDGGGPSKCDDSYHNNSGLIVALSTGWYAGGSRCEKMIRITTQSGASVTAKVVDECDSVNGCDAEHANQPPCRNNIVDASDGVWNALGLNIDDGEVSVTWSMA